MDLRVQWGLSDLRLYTDSEGPFPLILSEILLILLWPCYNMQLYTGFNSCIFLTHALGC